MQKSRDEADWSGIDFRSHDVCGQNSESQHRFTYNGYRYVTEGEWQLAQILDAMGMEFTPDVRIAFTFFGGQGAKGKRVIYVPDFIFNGRAYVWTDPKTGKEEVIHGLEAKGRRRKSGHASGQGKVKALYGSKRISVKILCAEEIREFFDLGQLPLHPL